MPSEAALKASSILRDSGQFQWYVITLFAVAVYVYVVEVEKRNWNVLLAALAFWGMDWFNETWNSLIFHFTGYAPAWAAPGHTAYLILIGLNIEICFMFAIAGVAFCKMLPADRSAKILGLPNRVFIAVTGAAFCVIVEFILNTIGALTWDWPWWNMRAPWLIFLFGYLEFFVVAFWVHDMKKIVNKVKVVGTIYAVDIVALAVFGPVLKWI